VAVTDIEIYVRDLDEERLLAWLDATCGSAREAWRNASQVGFDTARGPVIVTLRMEDGPFAGVAFPWGRALWPTDAHCARAAREMSSVVRCDPGPAYPGATEDHVLEIDGGAERLVLLLDDAPSTKPPKYDLDCWPHRWFGFWREYGKGYERCPSIHDFVRPDVAATYDKPALRRYLTTAQNVAMTSRAGFPDPFTGVRHPGAIGVMTDGRWQWLSDLPDYIERHGVAIPTAWRREIEARGFVPPPVDVSDPAVMAALDRPPVG
jgi:hypothetical protein